MNAKTIKMIATDRYEVGLFQLMDDTYVVGFETPIEVNVSEQMADFKTASFMFDLKLAELQGN
jgi:hypothetical protein